MRQTDRIEHRVRRLVAAGVAALCLSGPAAMTAAASQGWSLVPTPNPMMQRGILASTSCPTSTWCAAVGHTTDATGTLTALGETWDGTTWAMQSMPAPPGALATSLSSVSCTAPTACLAIGVQRAGAGADVPLAELWNGKRWIVQAAPSSGTLQAVACTSASLCEAVGFVPDPLNQVLGGGSDDILAERWSGSGWTNQTPVPLPNSGELAAVTCLSATACVAVGAGNGGGAVTYQWNGVAWLPMSVAPDSAPNFLTGVACASVRDCQAVGYLLVQLNCLHGQCVSHSPVAEHWDGLQWSVEPTPTLSGSDARLEAVSCARATDCAAVGQASAPLGCGSGGPTCTGLTTLAERWNGAAWMVEATPDLGIASPTYAELSGVSCASTGPCTAVGGTTVSTGVDNSTGTVGERWNGTSWALQATAEPTGAAFDSALYAGSCTATTFCLAVGTGISPQGTSPSLFFERWDGAAWVADPMPNPATNGFYLAGVACTSPTACVAVGPLGRGSFAERWNGATWAVDVVTPNTTPAPLGSVSCTAANACTAVGEQFPTSTSGTLTLVEHWDGTSWTMQPSPSVSGRQSSLLGVSCTSATSCTAVGYSRSSPNIIDDQTLVEHWDGTTWTIVNSPTPAVTGGGELVAVSCTSDTACTAVGNGSFAERWNGTMWTLQTTPGRMLSVSCGGATSCTAVGYNTAEHWDGTSWSLQPTANLAATTLKGVSCASPSTCMAVGVRQNTGAIVTVAEQFVG